MRINEEKISKFQAGGFMTYQPLPVMPEQPVQPISPTSGDAVQGEDSSVLDDEIFKKMIGEGISNDVVAFQENMNTASKSYAGLSPFEKNTAKGQRLRSLLKGDLASLNTLVRNKKQFDDLIVNVKTQAAAGELAITTRGMIVKDMATGRVGEVAHAEYAKDIASGDKRKYQALTNAELINEREYNKNLVGDSKSFEALNSAIGMTKVKEEIESILEKIGSTASKTTGNKYVDINSEKMAQGAKDIIGMAQQGVYNVTKMEDNSSNKEQLKLAAKAMWINLSENSRSVLKARAASRGVSGDKLDEEALSFAISLLARNETTSHASSMDVKFDKDQTENAGGGSGKDADVSYWGLLDGNAGVPTDIVLNEGSTYQFNVKGSELGGFMNGDKPYGNTTVNNIGQLSHMTDLNNVSFGGQSVDKSILDSLVYTNSKVVNVDLPFTTSNGKIVPDLETAKRLGTAQTKIQSLGRAATAQARETIYKQNGIPTNGKGEFTIPIKKFVTFEAMGNDEAIPDYDPRFVKHMGDAKDSNAIADLYKRTYVYDGKTQTKGNKIERGEYDTNWYKLWLDRDPGILRGMVYIPKTGNGSGGRIADGQGLGVNKGMTTYQHYRETGTEKLLDDTMTNSTSGAGKYQFTK